MFGAFRSAFPKGQVVYQIYPRSFQDSNADGVGDIPGIIQRLDYLADLGITALWLCPLYPSPMVDYGYDVADYTAVDPVFGSLQDLDELIRKAHEHNIRVLLDLVANHSSDQHSWFKESRSSLTNPKRDWYFWRDAKAPHSPPNNWISTFGGSAWEYDSHTGQYYLHSFAKQQPDLNWQNPEVRRAFQNIMRFWLDRGVDGFRVDAANWYSKDPSFRDDPINPAYNQETDDPYNRLIHYYSSGQPELFSYLREMTGILEPYHNRMMLVEAHFDMLFDVSSYANFYQRIDSRVAAPFNFIDLYLPWRATSFQRFIDSFQAMLKPSFTPVYSSGNHDRSRLATRIGADATRAAAVLFLTLPGTSVIYYGEEIGMEDGAISPDAVRDLSGRDPERTPMQWSADHHAGFSRHKPWLPIGKHYTTHNVATESADPHSLLSLYKKLLALRSYSQAIRQGTYIPLDLADDNLLGFTRKYKNEKLATVINFSRTETVPCLVRGEIVLTTEIGEIEQETLGPLEARIIRL